MSSAIYTGRMLQPGDRIYYDDSRDLIGTVTSKSDKRFEVQWEGGNAVWYRLHQMFETVGTQ